MFQTVKENTFKLFLPISKFLQLLEKKKKSWLRFSGRFIETSIFHFSKHFNKASEMNNIITQVLAFMQGLYTLFRKNKHAKINSRE